MNNIVMIAAVEAEGAAQAAEDQSLEGRLRAAMEATKSHWMATKDEDQFLAACEGVARTCSEEERERMETSLRSLQGLSALMAGVAVDVEALAAQSEDAEPIRLVPLWREVKES